VVSEQLREFELMSCNPLNQEYNSVWFRFGKNDYFSWKQYSHLRLCKWYLRLNRGTVWIHDNYVEPQLFDSFDWISLYLQLVWSILWVVFVSKNRLDFNSVNFNFQTSLLTQIDLCHSIKFVWGNSGNSRFKMKTRNDFVNDFFYPNLQ